MRYSTQIKPIDYLKSHVEKLLDRVTEEREPIIITQNGEARAVLMDVHSYDEMQERMAPLQILTIGEKKIKDGKTYALKDVVRDLRLRRQRRGRRNLRPILLLRPAAGQGAKHSERVPTPLCS
jgi:prevent-host-death family protein